MQHRSRMAAVLSFATFGAPAAGSAAGFPVSRIPAPGGEVVFANPKRARRALRSTWNAFCVDRHYGKRTVVEIVIEAYAPLSKP